MGNILTIFAAVGAIFLMTGVTGTPETTCKEAANSDKRVDSNFCVDELNGRPDTTEADTWGLAQITASIGIGNADDAIVNVKAMLAKPGTSGKMRETLEKCQKLYERVAVSFAIAHDDINIRDYTAGKEKLKETIPLSQMCEDAFAKGEVESPVTRSEAKIQ